jgi:uncharacterized membrane protein YiaA
VFRRFLIILLFPVVVLAGVLAQSVVLVVVFLLAELVGLESILNQLQITKILFGVAFIVSLFGAWKVSRRMWLKKDSPSSPP